MIKNKITLSGIKKYLKKNRILINKIEKYLQKKKITISKKKKIDIKGKDLGPLSRTFLSSLVIISIFFVTPTIQEFVKERKNYSKHFENNSANNFNKTLEGVASLPDSKLDNKFLFDDILEFDNLPTDSVRLSASTIYQLFEDTGYSLNDVRKEKLVKPISLTLLPQEMKMIENTKKRKDLFIQIILPLVIKENNNIKLDRKKLFSILNKNNNTKLEKNWLNDKFKQYGVLKKDLSTLKIRMDIVPVSLAIAQAAKETGWGTSRFALEGNALFGQWTWSGEGIKPAGADSDDTHKVMKFKILKSSVRAYQRNLNTHSSYKNFRLARAELRDNDKILDSIILANYLDKYAETGLQYVKILKKIIEQNDLRDFDNVRLLPSSMKLESLI